MSSKKSKAQVTNRLAYGAGGAIASLVVNYAASKVALKNSDESTKEFARKYLPVGKAVLGTVVALTSKNGDIRDAAIGFAIVSGVEGLQANVPMFQISGLGDLWETIGNPYSYDALPGASMGKMYAKKESNYIAGMNEEISDNFIT